MMKSKWKTEVQYRHTFVQTNPDHLYMKLVVVHAIIHCFGSKKLAPCKNFSWQLYWLLTFKTGTWKWHLAIFLAPTFWEPEQSLQLPTSVQPISITKTLLIVPTKNERDPPLFTGKLLIKFQNILRKTTQVIIRHNVKILFSVISSPTTLELQKWKSSKMKGILLSSPVNSW